MFRPAQTLTVGNAKSVLAAGLAAIAQGQTQFDLQDVATVDSSAVATLLAWQRAAQKQGKSLSFSNPSASLGSLIALYGVSELLPVSSVAPQRSDLPHH